MPLLLTVALAGLLAQSGAAAPAASIGGRVIEEGTNTPIAGAQIMLMPAPRRGSAPPFPDRLPTAITDRDGRYEFLDISPGTYRVNAQRAGFAGLTQGFPEIAIAPGQRATAPDIVLQRGAVITGRVFDDAGEPLAGARVMALRRPSAPPGVNFSQNFLMPSGPDAQTNDLGEFRLFGLQPGEYAVQANAGLLVAPARSTQRATTTVATYFPGTTDPAAAQMISLGPGQTYDGISIRLIDVPAFQIAGVVRDSAGRAVADALVQLRPKERASPALPMFVAGGVVHTDASGRFVLTNVTAGEYILSATPPIVTARAAVAPDVAGGGIISGSMSSLSSRFGESITTETRNGVTTEWREALGAHVDVAIGDRTVTDMSIVIPPQTR